MEGNPALESFEGLEQLSNIDGSFSLVDTVALEISPI